MAQEGTTGGVSVPETREGAQRVCDEINSYSQEYEEMMEQDPWNQDAPLLFAEILNRREVLEKSTFWDDVDVIVNDDGSTRFALKSSAL